LRRFDAIVSALVVLSLLSSAALAGSEAVARASTAGNARKSRVIARPSAPPRVLDGILGFLKRATFALSGSEAGADGETSAADGSGPNGSGASDPRNSSSGAGTIGIGGAGSRLGGLLGGSAGNGAGSGTNGTTTGSASDGADDGKVGFEENNRSSIADGSTGKAKGTGGGSAPPEKQLQKLSTVYPVCLFIDSSPGVQAKANAAIKGMVDMAAACDVQILAFPVVTTFPMGDDHNAINAEQVKACNIPAELGTEGKGSTSAFVPWDLTAAKMCDAKKGTDPNTGAPIWDEGVAGCAQVSAARGADGLAEAEAKAAADPKSEFARNLEAQRGNFKGRMQGGNIVPSIEVPSGHTAVVLSHEALGHSQMGRPNGKKMGNGIGEWGEPPGADKSGGDGGWTKPAGCSALKANAFPNTKEYRYDPDRETYFTPQTQRVYTLGSDPPIFTPRSPAPLPGPASGPQIAGNGMPNGGPSRGNPLGGEAIVSRTPPKGESKPSATTGIADKVASTPPKPAGRHETKGGTGVTLSELRQKNPPKTPERDDSFAVVSQKPIGNPPNAFGGGGSREALRIDETAGANTAIATVGTSGRGTGGSIFDASTTGGGGGGGLATGGKLGFDESMTANGPTSRVDGAAQPKLYLGKSDGILGDGNPSRGPASNGIDSALSEDFFSKIQLGGVEKERRRRNGEVRTDGRGAASSAGETEGVRSLRR
jgi:hypothetical protein